MRWPAGSPYYLNCPVPWDVGCIAKDQVQFESRGIAGESMDGRVMGAGLEWHNAPEVSCGAWAPRHIPTRQPPSASPGPLAREPEIRGIVRQTRVA